jgi:lauroyl/myristoyl acyltransferase
MPAAPFAVRMKTSTLVRRALPTRLAVARAERKARRRFAEHPPTRERALRAMEAVVAGTPRAGELEDLAREHVVETQAWEAMFWQPWPRQRIDARSSELLQTICAGERGVLLSACHCGPYFNKARTLVSIGIEPAVVSGDWFFEPPSPDYWGRRLARWRRGLPDLPLIRPRGSFRVLASLLAEGATVLVYFDMPGRHETNFLGKPVMLVDGSARLAVETGALVLPVRSRRVGHRPLVEAGEPLDPRDFAGVDELHEALARVHERAILEHPAAMADPSEFGWEQEAGPDAWRRPGRGEEGEQGTAGRP